MAKAPAWLMRRFWDAHSGGWDQVASGTDAMARRRDLLDTLSALVPDGARVVDLGCGAGHLATELAVRGLQVTAADFSPAMLERARRRAAAAGVSLALERVDLDGDLPWGPASFDVAVSAYVLQVVRDPVTFLARAAAVVAPGGVIVVDAPSGASDRFSLPTMRVRDRVLNEIKRASARLPGGVHWYDSDELRRVAESAGLTVVSVSPHGPARRLIARGAS